MVSPGLSIWPFIMAALRPFLELPMMPETTSFGHITGSSRFAGAGGGPEALSAGTAFSATGTEGGAGLAGASGAGGGVTGAAGNPGCGGGLGLDGTIAGEAGGAGDFAASLVREAVDGARGVPGVLVEMPPFVVMASGFVCQSFMPNTRSQTTNRMASTPAPAIPANRAQGRRGDASAGRASGGGSSEAGLGIGGGVEGVADFSLSSRCLRRASSIRLTVASSRLTF